MGRKLFQNFLGGNLHLKHKESSGKSDKVDDQELEHILEENSCQMQGELVEELDVTQPAISVLL